MGVSSVPSSDGNSLGIYDTGSSAEYAAVLDPILDRMPNGSDKEKAEYMVQQICDRFSYSSGFFNWIDGKTSGRCEAYANAVMAIFSRAGIPVIRAIGEKLFANSGKKRYNEFEVKKDVKH